MLSHSAFHTVYSFHQIHVNIHDEHIVETLMPPVECMNTLNEAKHDRWLIFALPNLYLCRHESRHLSHMLLRLNGEGLLQFVTYTDEMMASLRRVDVRCSSKERWVRASRIRYTPPSSKVDPAEKVVISNNSEFIGIILSLKFTFILGAIVVFAPATPGRPSSQTVLDIIRHGKVVDPNLSPALIDDDW